LAGEEYGISGDVGNDRDLRLMSTKARLRQHAKGSRPYFFEDPAVDKLLAMLLALVGEVSVMRDRQDTLERLIVESGTISLDEIEQYQPSDTVLAARDERRDQFLTQILRILDIDTSGMRQNDLSPDWQRIIDAVIKPDLK